MEGDGEGERRKERERERDEGREGGGETGRERGLEALLAHGLGLPSLSQNSRTPHFFLFRIEISKKKKKRRYVLEWHDMELYCAVLVSECYEPWYGFNKPFLPF